MTVAVCCSETQPGAVLGPGDLIAVRASHVADMPDKPIRIDDSGFIRLPLVGRVSAAGLTEDELAAQLIAKLDLYLRDPEVSVELVESKSHPVSVLGAVKTPGVYQLQGSKRLLEMLSAAGGVDQDADYTIAVTRGKNRPPFGVEAVHVKESGEFQVAEISLSDLMDGKRPEENIEMLPDDVITVPRAQLVYVFGEVHKAGGFALRDREKLSVVQALALAEGLTPTAGARNARILRREGEGGQKVEIPVDVKDILANKAEDMRLEPNDVLFIPNSAAKNAALRAVEAAIQMGTGVVIWRQ